MRRQLTQLQHSCDLYGDPLSDMLDRRSAPRPPNVGHGHPAFPQGEGSQALSPPSPEGNGSNEDKIN